MSTTLARRIRSDKLSKDDQVETLFTIYTPYGIVEESTAAVCFTGAVGCSAACFTTSEKSLQCTESFDW